MSHFPNTLDTRLDFNIEVSGSDLADGGVANRPGSYGEFFFSAALLKGDLRRRYNTDANTLTRMSLHRPYPRISNDAD